VIDVREFRSPVDEARYRALIDELRCPISKHQLSRIRCRLG